MADTMLKVGVVGLGRIFDLNSLGYRHNPGAQIVALCDSNPDQLARRHQEFPEAFCTTDYERFLAQKLDLIDVLTPILPMLKWSSQRSRAVRMSPYKNRWR